MYLVIKVIKIKGKCPVYEVNDRFVIEDGYKLKPLKKDFICMHSLASILPYYVALSNNVEPKKLGLSSNGRDSAYVQCLDPCSYTGGGTVTFKIMVKNNAKE